MAGELGDAVVYARVRVLESSRDARVERAAHVPDRCQLFEQGVANQRVRETQPLCAALDDETPSQCLAHAVGEIDFAVERLRQDEQRKAKP